MNKRLDELKSKLWMTNRLSETEDGYIKIIQPAKQRERIFLNGNSPKQLWVNTKMSNICRQADLRDTAGLVPYHCDTTNGTIKSNTKFWTSQ